MNRNIDISFHAAPDLRDALHRFGRSEDVRFSPDNRRLALVGSDRSSILIVDLDIATGGTRARVTVTDMTELSEPSLGYPHGVDFLDDETIVVADCEANVKVFGLPSPDRAVGRAELIPIDPPPDRGFELLDGPNAISIASSADGDTEVLIGHRRAAVVTRHVFHQDDPGSLTVTANGVLLRRWISAIDGLAVSPDRAWIALSAPWHQNVLVYERSSSLEESSRPQCILRGASYPHGVRFSADGRHLFVADAGSPYVHVHARDGATWRGVQYPAVSLRAMDDDTFQRGRFNCREGGPKGIDVDRRGHVLAVSSEGRPLAFFDVAALLNATTEPRPGHQRQMSYELGVVDAAEALVEERVGELEARLTALRGSRSFRVAEQLQRLNALRPRRRR